MKIPLIGFILAILFGVFIAFTPSTTTKPNNQNQPQADPITDPVVVAAGDISCASFQSTTTECNQQLTASLVKSINPDLILTLGDHQYPSGSLDNFNKYFDKSWGEFKSKIKPAVGNHEYADPFARGYFSYFGDTAGLKDQGYYSFDLGPSWHLISINSNCWAAGGCDSSSKQYTWLKNDLELNKSKCILAYWHHPRFSSGMHGDNVYMQQIFELLYSKQVELVLNGHDHTYERFAKVDSSGHKNDHGIRSFVVGTGGRDLYGFTNILPISESRQNQEFGVLKLTLHTKSYDWEFKSIKTDGFKDNGSEQCY